MNPSFSILRRILALLLLLIFTGVELNAHVLVPLKEYHAIPLSNSDSDTSGSISICDCVFDSEQLFDEEQVSQTKEEAIQSYFFISPNNFSISLMSIWQPPEVF